MRPNGGRIRRDPTVQRERGQVMPVATIVVVFVMLGFWALVSAGQAWTARRDVYAVAAVAAVAGAQGQIDQLRGAGDGELDPAVAEARARRVLDEAGLAGTVEVRGQVVVVTATAAVRYALPAPGMPATVTGSASAVARRGVNGQEGG